MKTKSLIQIECIWEDNTIGLFKTENNFIIGQSTNSNFIMELPDVNEHLLVEYSNGIWWFNNISNHMYFVNKIPISDNKVMIEVNKDIEIIINNITFKIGFVEENNFFRFEKIDNIFPYVFLSLLTHMSLLLSMFFFLPNLGLTDENEIGQDQIYLMQQYLSAAAERELENKESEQIDNNQNADDKEGGTGSRAIGEEGSMGNPNSRDTNKRFGIQGDGRNMSLSRASQINQAMNFGIIGLLNTGSDGGGNYNTPWSDITNGADALSARGNMWGDAVGESFGIGGLGLSGIGEGGGGKFMGIGLGSIGTIGHGNGLGDGQGFGNGHGRLNGGHRTRTPIVRIGTTSVNGRLPPEIVQRIMRQNYGRFRMCFENGLRNNPSLNGRVTIRFVIGRDGSVSNVGNGGSDLPDSGVVSCVLRSTYGVSFPVPEGGIVTVVYPIMFSPQ